MQVGIPIHFCSSNDFCFLSPFPHPPPLWQFFSMVAGNIKFARGLQTYLLSRDHSILKSEFQLGNGKVCLCFLGLCPLVTIKTSWTENYSMSYILSFFPFFLLQITVSCIENLPPVNLVLGEHVFLTVGDYFSWTKKSG
jgi:isoleucyl-tRNA synthetase